MGGYFSSRWRWHTTKPDTDPLLFLDVRYLARNGYLDAPPGETRFRSLSWSRRGETTGWIGVIVTGAPEGPLPEIVLDYRTRRGDSGPWTDVRERIVLDYTECHYGGERPWLVCPGCGKRKAVLRSVTGRFRCNACNGVAYSSTREDFHDRMCRKAQDARRRLGAEPGPIWHHPPKPKGMHWRTYERICRPIDGADEILSMSLFDLERRFARFMARHEEPPPASPFEEWRNAGSA